MEFRDKNGKKIEPGQTLKRVIDGRGANAGHIFTVVQYDFKTGEPGEDLVADGGFIKELLWPERCREYQVVND